MHSTSLDSSGPNRNKFCGRWAVTGIVERDLRRYSRLRCRAWKCDHCGGRKASSFRKAVSKAAAENHLTRLLTLTLNPRTCSAKESAAYIRDCWNKFRISLQRHTGQSVRFILIMEFQKSGYAHLHVLVDRYLEQRWISEAWQAVGGGRIVDIRTVDVHNVGGYLSKYLSKDFGSAGFKPGERRYSTSRGIRLFDRTPKGWILDRRRIDLTYQVFERVAVEVEWRNDELIWFDIPAKDFPS